MNIETALKRIGPLNDHWAVYLKAPLDEHGRHTAGAAWGRMPNLTWKRPGYSSARALPPSHCAAPRTAPNTSSSGTPALPTRVAGSVVDALPGHTPTSGRHSRPPGFSPGSGTDHLSYRGDPGHSPRRE